MESRVGERGEGEEPKTAVPEQGLLSYRVNPSDPLSCC